MEFLQCQTERGRGLDEPPPRNKGCGRRTIISFADRCALSCIRSRDRIDAGSHSVPRHLSSMLRSRVGGASGAGLIMHRNRRSRRIERPAVDAAEQTGSGQARIPASCRRRSAKAGTVPRTTNSCIKKILNTNRMLSHQLPQLIRPFTPSSSPNRRISCSGCLTAEGAPHKPRFVAGTDTPTAGDTECGRSSVG